MNLIEVDCTDINKNLCKECESIIHKLNSHILTWNTERAIKINKDFDIMNSALTTRADTEKKLVESESYKDKCREVLIPRLFEEFNDLKQWFMMLYDTPFQISEDSLAPLKVCNTWVKSILSTLQTVENRLQGEKDVLVAQLKEVRKSFGEELNAIEQEINKRKVDSERSMYKDFSALIANLKIRLEKAVKKMEDINEKETLLG